MSGHYQTHTSQHGEKIELTRMNFRVDSKPPWSARFEAGRLDVSAKVAQAHRMRKRPYQNANPPAGGKEAPLDQKSTGCI